ncbi:helix-turn-helix transcriptional regulator, partial [Thioclava sp. BHET1]
MRVSRAKSEENRQAVIDAAARLFRERGFDGIGLSDLMKSVGLTHGGFYKKFASKEDLIRQASAAALSEG